MNNVKTVLSALMMIAFSLYSSAQEGQSSENDIINDYVKNMVMVNGGTFMMGATDGWGYDDERPIHSVTLTSFMISKYEVTQQLWQIVMGDNPSTVQGDNLPVNNISWDDCQTFIAKLNKKTGRTYRMATEAEWEFAARGGTAGKDLGEGNGYQYSGGYHNITSMDSYVWNSDNSDNTIHPVGTKSPNELGLYDMSGNVCEYVQDYLSSAYPEEAQHNPLGPESGDYRVYRGGSYTRPTWQCRLASRFGINSINKREECGLRLVMDAGPNAKMMVITTIDGKQTKLGLKNEANLTIEKPYLVYKSNIAEMRFDMNLLRDIQYEDVPQIPGDASGDGMINAGDIIEIVKHIMGQPSLNFNYRNSDTNNDGIVNIADIVQITNGIINLEKDDIPQNNNTSSSDNQSYNNQQPQYALYNYRNDNSFNAFLNVDIDKITFSNIGLDGSEYKNAVTQEVWTSDSLYRIPLEAIDSIGFRAPAPVYKDNVFHIRRYHIPYIQQTDGLSLIISRTIDRDSIPVVGQIVISDVIEEPLPRGFSGRVLSVESTSSTYVFTCEAVALTDIFERLLLVGRSESFTPEEIQQTRRKNSPDETEWDGIVPFEVGKLSLNIPSIEGVISNSNSDMTLGTISISPRFCVSYIIDIRPFVHSHVKILFENKSKVTTEMHLKVGSESSLTESKKARVYFTKVPIPLVPGVLYGEVAVSGDLYLKGNLDLKATFTKNLYNGDEYEWSTSDFWNINHKRYDKDPKKTKKGDDDNDDNQLQSDVSLSINGSFGFGASLDLVMFAVSEKTLEISNTLTVGPELSGSLKFNSEGLKDGTLYSTLKDTNVTFTSMKVSDEVKFNICMREFTLGSYSISSGTKEFKLFPDFEPLFMTKYPTQGDYANLPLGLYTIVKNDVIPIIPLKLGIGRYDQNNNLIDECFASDFYQYEDEWDNRKLCYDMSSLLTGNSYTFHPLIRIWGLKSLQLKAMPETVINIPPTLSLSSSLIKLARGDEREISIFDGWGDYEVKSLDNSVASAFLVTHTTGGKNPIMHIKGNEVGETIIQVKDMRSNETASIKVVVTDEEITPLNLSSSSLALSVGKDDSVEITSGSGRYLVESSNPDVATAEISDNNILVTALKEGTTKITVTDIETTLTTCIDVTVSEEESPYIPDKTGTITVNGVSFNMVKVEGGTFMMGSETGDPDESPQHEVTLDNYYIGQTEVTQELWKAVMGSNSSQFTSSDQLPVDALSWDDCQQFVTTLNEKTGLKFRLPTEAEWEYASRGGNKTQGFIFSGSNAIDEVAWYSKNSGIQTHCVASKIPNELGLYDMSGNVWEWCQDWYNTYSSEIQTNPVGPSSGPDRVLRGGGYASPESNCRSTNRDDDTASSRGYGMRLALSAGEEVINIEIQEGAVDLGLPSGTLWASCNVGASSPEEYGGYYSWGETEEKDEYTWGTYSLCTDGDSKTCVDLGNIVGTQYDVAHVRWGAPWTMPTLEQMDELVKHCSSEWTEVNGVKGRKYTGPNGKSIFLPAGGYKGKKLNSLGSSGEYQTSSLGSSGVYILYFGSKTSDLYHNYYNYSSTRATGRCVRPVISKSQQEEPAETVDLGLPSGTLWASCNLGAAKPEDAGKFYAWGETKAYGEEYPENKRNYDASGSYIKTDFYPETYIFGDEDMNQHSQYTGGLTKYFDGDGKTTLDPEDDVAHLLLGGNWHIPTIEEWQELLDNCTIEKTEGGSIVKSNINNASIFLPLTGNRYENEYKNAGYGQYWSSTRLTSSGLDAQYMVKIFQTSSRYKPHIYNGYRFDGLAIRPVMSGKDNVIPDDNPSSIPGSNPGSGDDGDASDQVSGDDDGI